MCFVAYLHVVCNLFFFCEKYLYFPPRAGSVQNYIIILRYGYFGNIDIGSIILYNYVCLFTSW